MADELDLELDDELQEKVSKSQERIKSLSEKVKLTSQERDDLAKEKETLAIEKAQLAKENDFHKNFNSLIPKYQGAVKYQDKIKEKVLAGYSVEDATTSELIAAGEYIPPEPALASRESPAGGSATTALKAEGEKKLSEMTREEKLAKLKEDEGSVADLLTPKFRI